MSLLPPRLSLERKEAREKRRAFRFPAQKSVSPLETLSRLFFASFSSISMRSENKARYKKSMKDCMQISTSGTFWCLKYLQSFSESQTIVEERLNKNNRHFDDFDVSVILTSLEPKKIGETLIDARENFTHCSSGVRMLLLRRTMATFEEHGDSHSPIREARLSTLLPSRTLHSARVRDRLIGVRLQEWIKGQYESDSERVVKKSHTRKPECNNATLHTSRNYAARERVVCTIAKSESTYVYIYSV